MSKARIAFVELAGAAGLLYSLLSSPETRRIIDESEIVYWPTIGKTGPIEDIDIAFISGTAKTRSHVNTVRSIRENTRILVAYGTSAIYGGVPGMTALLRPGDHHGYMELDEEHKNLEETVRPITSITEPDILVPGEPPSEEANRILSETIEKLLNGEAMNKPIYVFTGENLCKHCPRRPKNIEKLEMPGIKSVFEVDTRNDKCFLELGILCMGPVTASGCGHVCIRMNQPCTGCNGPARGVVDQGLNYISSFTSILLKSKERQVMFDYFAKELDKLHDPMGYFYRYTLPKAMLTRLALKKRGVEE